MERRAVRGVLALGGAAVVAAVVLGLLRFFLPGCSDVPNWDSAVLCMGGLGEPMWKAPLVFLLVALVAGTAIRKRIK